MQIAIRYALEEAIALRDDLNSLGLFGIVILEVCKDGRRIYHCPPIKHGDPLGLSRLLD